MPRIVPSEIVRIIDDYFDWAAKPTEPKVELNIGQMGRASAIIGLIDRLPDDLIELSPSDYADFLASVEMLRVKASIAIEKGSGYRFNGDAVWRLRHALAKCPDSSSRAAGHELKFIRPIGLREDLRRDLAEANHALREGRWKAATILSGSIIEALLVWKLLELTATARQAAISTAVWRRPKDKPNGPPEEWKLFQLIEVARAAGSITADTTTQITLARNYRNLIHPGRTLKTGERCGKDTALAALSGVERVLRDVGT